MAGASAKAGSTVLKSVILVGQTPALRLHMNVNETGASPTVWRYAHFDSHGEFTQKRAVLMACLQKVQKMASDYDALRSSAIQKVAEFAALNYPRKMLWTACTTMGVTTRSTAWFRVREQLPCM